MAGDLPQETDIPASPQDNRLDSPTCESKQESRELVAWPLNNEQRQEWNDALRSFAFDQTKPFPGSLDSEPLRQEGNVAKTDRLDFRPAVSREEITGLRDILVKAGLLDRKDAMPAAGASPDLVALAGGRAADVQEGKANV